jgi:hypothetical protein
MIHQVRRIQQVQKIQRLCQVQEIKHVQQVQPPITGGKASNVTESTGDRATTVCEVLETYR